MYGGYFYGFGFDWTLIFIVIGCVISWIASSRMKRTFAAYEKIRSSSGMTGRETAQKILHSVGIHDVEIVPIKGSLTDHYDPAKKRLCLSEPVYNRTSLAAVGVAAHECGHAVQHAGKYVPLRIRTAIVPVANIGSSLSWPILLIGIFFSIRPLLWLGIIFFSASVLFQIVTLPVEMNASNRALKLLSADSILLPQEVKGARKVLRAAAMTYVAGAAASILQLLRLLLISGGRRR